MSYNYLDAAFFRGKTITAIIQPSDEELFFTADGKRYQMFHCQDCCEHVRVTHVDGVLTDLIGSPLTVAHEEVNGSEADDGSATETTYTFATENSTVRIFWLGTSNGHYSESVQIQEIE